MDRSLVRFSRFASIAVAATALGSLFGCNAPKEAATTAGKPEGKLSGKLEVVAFKGGYDIDFYQKAAAEFQKLHPDLQIDVTGNPRVWEQLRPRFIAGTPPDLCFPGWGMDHWALAEEGQLEDLDPALDTMAADGKTKWRDTFEPQLLKLGQLEGKQYVLPYYFMALGWWYDPGVFAKHDWTPPKTYEELLALAPKIKAAGIAPITFQGKYPYYMTEGMLLPWAISAGGVQAVTDAQNLVPGAWKSPAMLKAAQMIQELRDKGFFQKGATAMSHTESQQEFLQGHAAMIPCGTWLESEMRKVAPPGAKMRFMLPPVLAGGKGDPTTLLIAIEPWMVPSAAKNKDAAVALYKYMTSLDVAKRFVAEKGTFMAIKGANDGPLPDSLVAAGQAFKAAKSTWADQFRNWYPAMETAIENALTSLLNGEIDAPHFCDRAEAAAEATRKDVSLPKHKVG